MLSAPPATAASTSPSRMYCEALTIACMPLPQRRLSVSAPDSAGSPPLSAATRDRYMSFGSVWITLPNTTWPTSSGATFARASASRTQRAPSSVGAKSLSEPPKSPIAVRTPETTTTSRPLFILWLHQIRITTEDTENTEERQEQENRFG